MRAGPQEDLPALQARVAQGEMPAVVRELQAATLDVDAERYLLYLQRHLGDVAGARSTAGHLLGRDPGDAFARQTLAAVAWTDGDYAGARAQYSRLERLAQQQGDESGAAAARRSLEDLRTQVEAAVQPAREARAGLDLAFALAVVAAVLLSAGVSLWCARARA